jgi:hypothetical protein
MKKSPIFIAGPDRSGTTLLYALLASHPNIAMVRRTNYWRWFYGRFGNLDDESNFERLLDKVIRYKRIEPLNPDEDRIRKEFWEGKPSYGRFFALLQEHNMEREGKTRWGDKSLHTEHYIDQVMKEFPRAKIIHTIRDPRDRYASERKRFGKDNPRLGASTAKCLSSIKAAKVNRTKYPNNYMIVRFEDLVNEPEITSRKICDFIGEKYDPAMLTLQGAARYQKNNGNSSFGNIEPGVISKKPLGRYKEVLSPLEIAYIQLFMRKIMKEFNYPLENVKFTIWERLKYFIWIFPMQFIRMIGWEIIVPFERKNPRVPEKRFYSNELGKFTHRSG